MSKNISLNEIKEFWPEKAPDINIVQKYVKKYENEKIVIKYGGNVLIDRNVFNNFISDMNVLNRLGLSIIVVHGGGPRIKRELDKKKIISKFINGLRVTDKNKIGRSNRKSSDEKMIANQKNKVIDELSNSFSTFKNKQAYFSSRQFITRILYYNEIYKNTFDRFTCLYSICWNFI